jgi:mono/diheme cytochrome c family protein
MKKRLFYLLLFSLTGLMSCRDKNVSSDTWPLEALIVPTGVQADSLPDPMSRGAILLGKYCSQCHGTPSPASHNSSDWVPVFRRMILMMERSNSMGMMGGRMMGNRMMGGGMMGMMRGSEVPDQEEQQELLKYLQSHALISIQKEELPDAQSEGAELFSKDCSKCHALPDPSKHLSTEWPAVISRMRQHMVQLKMDNLSDQEADEILNYLEQNAGEALKK